MATMRSGISEAYNDLDRYLVDLVGPGTLVGDLPNSKEWRDIHTEECIDYSFLDHLHVPARAEGTLRRIWAKHKFGYIADGGENGQPKFVFNACEAKVVQKKIERINLQMCYLYYRTATVSTRVSELLEHAIRNNDTKPRSLLNVLGDMVVMKTYAKTNNMTNTTSAQPVTLPARLAEIYKEYWAGGICEVAEVLALHLNGANGPEARGIQRTSVIFIVSCLG